MTGSTLSVREFAAFLFLHTRILRLNIQTHTPVCCAVLAHSVEVVILTPVYHNVCWDHLQIPRKKSKVCAVESRSVWTVLTLSLYSRQRQSRQHGGWSGVKGQRQLWSCRSLTLWHFSLLNVACPSPQLHIDHLQLHVTSCINRSCPISVLWHWLSDGLKKQRKQIF